MKLSIALKVKLLPSANLGKHLFKQSFFFFLFLYVENPEIYFLYLISEMLLSGSGI